MTTDTLIVKTSGIYSLVLGCCIFILWIFILSGTPLEEGRVELTFHLISEWVMASLCIGSGLCLIRGMRKALKLSLVAHSMVIYSLLNAAGYYAQRGDGNIATLFIVLLFPSILILSFASGLKNSKSN
jgi:hypothetical protein